MYSKSKLEQNDKISSDERDGGEEQRTAYNHNATDSQRGRVAISRQFISQLSRLQCPFQAFCIRRDYFAARVALLQHFR